MKWGDFVITTHDQDFLRAIPAIPVGTRCFVVKEIDTPAYDLIVCPEGFSLAEVDLETGCELEHHTVYLFKNSWKPDCDCKCHSNSKIVLRRCKHCAEVS